MSHCNVDSVRTAEPQLGGQLRRRFGKDSIDRDKMQSTDLKKTRYGLLPAVRLAGSA